MVVWRSWAAPWVADDIHESLKTAGPEQIGPLFGAAAAARHVPSLEWQRVLSDENSRSHRHQGSKVHRSHGNASASWPRRCDAIRGARQLQRFVRLRSAPHAHRRAAARPVRAPDEALYALALFIYSLEPPPNPNRNNPGAADGQRVFQREGCGGCHTPPLYTNNRLTLASGFTPPPEHFTLLDIMRVSVGTDPNLALKTRKGTGYYKVPSLKGVWYRGRYLHDGSLTKLEEMFDPARLRDDYAPTGFMLPGQKTRAVPGHVFGMKLNETDRDSAARISSQPVASRVRLSGSISERRSASERTM